MRGWWCLLCVWTMPASGLTPTWSVDLGGFEWDSTQREVKQLVMVGSDRAMYVSGPTAGSRISVLTLSADESIRDHVLAPVDVLGYAQPLLVAGNPTGALLSLDLGTTRGGATVRLDAEGRELWRLDRPISSAQLLAYGDAVIVKQHIVTRLAATDGRVLWARNLFELEGSADDGRYTMGPSDGKTIELTARYRIGPEQALVNLAVDVANGELLWAAPIRPELQAVGVVCPPAKWGADRIDARFERDDDRSELVVERRAADGSLLSSVRHPSSGANPEICTVKAVGATLYLSLHDSYAPPQLWAINVDGTLRWKRDITSTRDVRMFAADSQDLVLAQGVYATAQYILSRVRAEDGAQLWSVDIPARLLNMHAQNDGLSIAWKSSITGQAHFDRRDLTSGGLISAKQDNLPGVRERGHAAIGWSGMACAAEARADAPESIEMSCRQGDSGIPVWTTVWPAVEAGERIDTLALDSLGNTGLLLRASTTTTMPEGDWLRDRLYALEAATGQIRWQSAHDRLLGLKAGIDGEVYVWDRGCALPPHCPGEPYHLRRLAGGDGAEVWAREGGMSLLAADSSLLIGWSDDSASRGFHAFHAATGAPRWQQLVGNGLQSLPAALFTRSGAVFIKYESTSGSTRSIKVRRLDGATGSQIYELTPREPQPFMGSSLLHESEDGDLLLSATRTGGAWIQRTAVIDGATRWDAFPAAGALDQRRVRFPPGRPDARWAVQIRTAELLERRALSAMDPHSGALGGEHLYAVAATGEATPFGSVTVLDVAPDGRVLALDDSGGRERLHATRLQGWPAPIGATGDVRIEPLETDAGKALGPSSRIRINVRNDSAATLSGVWLRAWSANATLWFRTLECAPSAACATPTRDAIELAMPAHSTVQVLLDVYDAGWTETRPRGGDRAYFRVDTPFDFGDLDLGNNLATAFVQLGGMSSGFE